MHRATGSSARSSGGCFRLLRTGPDREQRWGAYAASLLALSAVSVLALYVLFRVQGVLPFNPTGASGMDPALAFNTAVSFVTGTDWQAYAGESAMSHLSQMVGLVVVQFLAGAVGIAASMALVRGLARRSVFVGNFWVDVTRAIVRVLLPIAVVAATALIALGTVQNLSGNRVVTTLEGAEQLIPGGPVATQVVGKTLASNGGGFYNANSTHPFDNPNGLTNAIQLFLCLVLPFSLPFAYGRMVGDRRQGRVLLVVMAVLWILPLTVGVAAETSGNTHLPDGVSAGRRRRTARREHGGQRPPLRTRRLEPAHTGLDGHHGRHRQLGHRQLHAGRAGRARSCPSCSARSPPAAWAAASSACSSTSCSPPSSPGS